MSRSGLSKAKMKKNKYYYTQVTQEIQKSTSKATPEKFDMTLITEKTTLSKEPIKRKLLVNGRNIDSIIKFLDVLTTSYADIIEAP